MDKILEQVRQMALQYGARRLVLFGSRARGDARPGSDYDFAIWGVAPEHHFRLLDGVEELPSLYKMDVVFVDGDTSPLLLEQIQKDGVVLLDKYQIKRENYAQALQRLAEGLEAYAQNQSEIVRDGVIQRFEFTSELAWKAVREYLLDQGCLEVNSPKAVMRQAFAAGLISDERGWISLLNDRNQTSHVYDAKTADTILGHIRTQYLALFQGLLSKLPAQA